MSEEATKPTGLALLREPFPENQISQKPQPTCSADEWKKLPRGKCSVCGGWHATSKTIHLSYVGHAALTDRLLDVDPNWSWEPLAMDQRGLPAVDENGGMWIKLTVCGVTRFGYGDSQGKNGPNAVKERIGDALRNAAMRFGAALELWHKGDLHVEEDDEPAKPPAQAPPKSNGPPPARQPPSQSVMQMWQEVLDRASAAIEKCNVLSDFTTLLDKLVRTMEPCEDAEVHDLPLRVMRIRIDALVSSGALQEQSVATIRELIFGQLRAKTPLDDSKQQAEATF